MVTAARAGGRPSPSCGRWAPRLWRWPWRCRCWRPSAWGIGPCCGCRGCCRSPRSRPVHLLQVAVAPPTLVGYLTAGATPVWLLGSFAVLSLLYRTPAPADPAAEVEDEEPAGEEPSKREGARQTYAALSPPASPSPVPGWSRPPRSAPATAAPCWSSSKPTPPSPAMAAGSGPTRRWGSGDGDHLADLPSCGASFEQPHDPGRKRVYCSRACQQAAYRARQRTSAGQHTGRQDWRSERQEQRHQRAGSQRFGADQRQDWQDQQHRRRRSPPGSDNGHRPGATS
jgi:hypothetical protein